MLSRHIKQEVCPWNGRFRAEPVDARYAARGPGERLVGVEPLPDEDAEHPGTRAPALVELMAMTESAWNRYSRGSAIRRAGYVGFHRNVAVALGNVLGREPDPGPEVRTVLFTALEESEPLVRAHAAWALGQSTEARVADLLKRRLPDEPDESVREEIEVALGQRANPA